MSRNFLLLRRVSELTCFPQKRNTDFEIVKTVPVYVAESVARKYRGNLVSLYQFNIALGEVFGYVVAAIFVNVKVNPSSSSRSPRSLTDRPERQLALYAWLLPRILYHHVGRHVLHARVPPLPHAQRPHP